jgi:2-amino-4-hydroxy-6-hydroxymethyldihydropteridine diphosphokinase
VIFEPQNVHLVCLALGSNLGRRQRNLDLALQRLYPAVTVLETSRRYETAPAYVLNQPAFLNMAVRGETTLLPHDLLVWLKQFEVDMGRRQSFRYGPRLIDLDIIFYDDWVINTPDLQVPHPRLAERGFVLHPLADIVPDLVHPVLHQTVTDLVAALPKEDGILRVID